MSPIINATATKPTPSAKLGIAYLVKDDGVVITNVNEKGLLSTSGLKVGHQIVTINGTHVDGLTVEEVGAALASSKIHITARPEPFVAFFKVDRGSVTELNFNRNAIPEILEAAGVPMHKWRKICHLIGSEMAQATAKSVEMERIFRSEMSNYRNQQMAKGYIGFGTESMHEKKVFCMTHQCAALDNNATLAATDASIRANALLAQHGIVVSVFLMSKESPKFSSKQRETYVANKPYGLRFTSLE